MATENFNIGEGDGWVQVTTGPRAFVRISGVPHSHPFYLFSDTVAPAATDVGVLVCHHPFEVNVSMTENLYARIVNPVPNSKSNDGKLRLDVFTV